jgi:uncharacterized membrane protein
MRPPSFVTLHVGQTITLAAYLVRVVVVLLVVVGTGVAAFCAVRVVEIVRSAMGRRRDATDGDAGR